MTDNAMDNSGAPVLQVSGLTMRYDTRQGQVKALEDVSFDLYPGQTLGIVGESGSGKTSIAICLMKLLPDNARIAGGRVLLDGQDLLDMGPEETRAFRWRRIAMIFQAAMNSLDPVYRVGDQIVEAIEAHEPGISTQAARERTNELFELVGLDPQLTQRYPHEYSGGMRQRAVIAMSLACRPDVVIADEPTTALDVIVQDRILRRLKEIQNDLRMSMIYITHDMAVVAEVADRIGVMYAGNLVELGGVEDVFHNPIHPYTSALLSVFPQHPGAETRTSGPAGGAAGPDRPAPRLPVPSPLPPGHRRLPEGSAAQGGTGRPLGPLLEPRAGAGRIAMTAQPSAPANIGEPLVRVEGLTKLFPVTKGLFRAPSAHVHAVDDVNFELRQGESFGLVGESGCGKTTIGKLLVKLIEPTGGRIMLRQPSPSGAGNGEEYADIADIKGRDLKAFRSRAQMIFQDPFGSMNPRLTIFDTIAEPLSVQGIGNSLWRLERVREMLELVGLTPASTMLFRYPHELSGGQRQRAAIARALVVEPTFVVADEPTSMLDVSFSASIMRLMAGLAEQLGVTWLYITHDLAVARYMCQRIAVMYLGKIVELADTEELLANPLHPYTRALLSAVPTPTPGNRREPVNILGDISAPIDPHPRCRFHDRCPMAAQQCYDNVHPPMEDHGGGHWVACYRV